IHLLLTEEHELPGILIGKPLITDESTQEIARVLDSWNERFWQEIVYGCCLRIHFVARTQVQAGAKWQPVSLRCKMRLGIRIEELLGHEYRCDSRSRDAHGSEHLGPQILVD